MGRTTKALAYGIGGIVLAVAMSMGAFALAGSSLSHPTANVRILGDGGPTAQPHASSGASWTPEWSPDPRPSHAVEPAQAATSTPSPTTGADDHSGSTQPSGSPSDDDHSGGSGDDDHDDD
jgi:hypothetical protein